MKGCPFCEDYKKMLEEENIEFFDRDIDEFEEEYELFVEITNNEMIPAMLIIEGDDKDYKSFLYAPERDYNELVEALDIVKKHKNKVELL
jgi:glutaredoxin